MYKSNVLILKIVSFLSQVYCKLKKYPELLGLTRIDPLPIRKVLTASDPDFDVKYNIITEQAKKAAEISGYCYQQMAYVIFIFIFSLKKTYF